MSVNEIQLRYGCNPHQIPARIFSRENQLPITILNGKPGYINLLDALNSWQLVSELKKCCNLPAAASFKHVSPAGAAVGIPLTSELSEAYFADGIELTPLATAYIRARGADRLSSFGDWAALSDPVDVSTARFLKREVSDGIIAPGFEPDALALLKEKKKGNYSVIEIDPDYTPPTQEQRDVFGIVFEQKHNSISLDATTLENIVTVNKIVTDDAVRDLLIAQITLKYTQSNSVCFVLGGQVIGVGAGQQSRIHCTRLAASKADRWFLRQHPTVRTLPFKEKLGRPARDNAIDQFLEDALSPAEESVWKKHFTTTPQRLTQEEKREYLSGLKGVSLGSDAFFPFRDNIDRARQSGVSFIVQPGGSVRDDAVIEACNEYNMVMAMSGIRLFHH